MMPADLERHLEPFPPFMPEGWYQAMPYRISRVEGVHVVAAVETTELPRRFCVRLSGTILDTYLDANGNKREAEDLYHKLRDLPYFERFEDAVRVADAYVLGSTDPQSE